MPSESTTSTAMNQKFFLTATLFLLVVSRSHADLKFSIVPSGVTASSATLNAVAIGTTSSGASLAAVGNNSAVLSASLTNGGGDFFSASPSVWSPNSVPTNGLNLRAVAFGGGFFVASGSNNVIFTATNGSGWTGTNRAMGAGTTFEARGLTFGGSNFVMVPSAVDIRYAGVGLAFRNNTNWNDAINTNASFLESYRAVAPYGPNGFALCGTRGLVRYSTNDGILWWPSQPYNLADTNYLGIATDGSSNLVCVGEGGYIKFCTNGGFLETSTIGVSNAWFLANTNWQTSLSGTLGLAVPGTNIQLNAVTYAGANNGFIAVGGCAGTSAGIKFNYGFVILSTNGGADWTLQTSFLANQTNTLSRLGSGPQTNMYAAYQTNSLVLTNRAMYGAAFAASGYLKGLAVLVGDGGTVIVCGAAPPPPTNRWNITTYADYDQFTNPPPILEVVVSDPNTVTADWYDINGNLVSSNSTTFLPAPTPNWTDNTLVTSNYFVYARDKRTGLINTNNAQVTLWIRPRPTGSIVLTNIPDPMCNYALQPYYVTNNLTGIYGTNFTMTWWGSNSVSASKYVVTNGFLSPSSTSVLTLAPNSSFYPTNVLANYPEYFYYWVSNLVDTYGNRVTNSDVFYGTNMPPYLYPNLPMIASDTAHQDLVGTNSITVNPRPNSTLLPLNTTNCNYGISYTLTNILTGIGPWTLIWSSNTVSVTQYVSNVSGPYTNTFTVVPTNALPNSAYTNIYYIYSISNDDSCFGNQPGDILGTNTVVINPRPTATLVSANTTNCNYGLSYTIQANLTGLTNWNVTWWDGAVSNYTSIAGTVGLAVRVVYPTNALPNLPTNYQYWIAGVTNVNGCFSCGGGCTNWAGDLHGTNTVTVNPRPTATLVSMNATNCNYGLPYMIQANLTGLTNWNVTWWDGAVSNYTAGYGAAGLAQRVVYPTNVLANLPTNYQYWITGVTNINGCVPCGGGCTNWAGDLHGTNTVTVNPRPTASLVSTNLPNYYFVFTNCNYATSYTITNILTGIGPWTVTWSSNGVAMTYTNLGIGPGPYTNRLAVYPTNSLLGGNWVSNNIYYISSVQDANTCYGEESGDILGTNDIYVYPLPTATLAVSTQDIASIVVYTNPLSVVSTNILLIGITEKSASGLIITNNARTKFSFSYAVGFIKDVTVNLTNITLYATNHISLTGVGPWSVVLSDGTTTTSGVPNMVTNTYVTTQTNYIWAELVNPGTPGTNFLFSILNVQAANQCAGYFTNNSFDLIVNGLPTADILAPSSVCGGAATNLLVYLGGIPPWTNFVWTSNGVSYTVPKITNTPYALPVFLTNNYPDVTTNYTFAITNLADSATNTISPSDLDAVAITVFPIPTNAPVAIVTNIATCYDVVTNFTVTLDSSNFTASWFDATGTNLLATGLSFTATNAMSGAVATNIYYVHAKFNATNCECYSYVTAMVSVAFWPCTNQLHLNSSTSNKTVVINWYGNYVLEHSTNLLNPMGWMYLTQGVVGPNTWTNSTVPPPTNNFFRLFAP